MDKEKRKLNSGVGLTLNGVIEYSKESYKEGVAINLSKMGELEGRFGYNGGIGCDVLEGPCSCGAWHTMDWKKCREAVAKWYAFLLEELDENIDESGRIVETFSERSRVSMILRQKQPYVELQFDPAFKDSRLQQMITKIKKSATDHHFVISQGKFVGCELVDDEHSYTFEPDYRNEKRLFGFII